MQQRRKKKQSSEDPTRTWCSILECTCLWDEDTFCIHKHLSCIHIRLHNILHIGKMCECKYISNLLTYCPISWSAWRMIFHKQVTKNIKKRHPLVAPILPHSLNPYFCFQITHSTGHWPSLHGAVMPRWACNRWDDETQPPVDMDHFLCLPGRCWKGYTKTMKAKKFASGETDMFLVDVCCQALSWNWCCHTKCGLLQSKVFYISIDPATFREQLELEMMQFSSYLRSS